jgi:hypothetical protein
MISPHRDRFFATAEPPTPDPDPEVAELVATLKRAAMDSAYMRNLRGIIPDFAANAPVFDRTLQTSSMRLAAIACARQGFDAGRYATSSACPYPMGATPWDTFARRAWMVGFTAGQKVDPRPEPRPLAQRPIILRPS